MWLLWLLSQTWVTLHIWTPKCERLASTEKLFVTPMYNGLLIDQAMGLNRRRDDEADVKTEVSRSGRQDGGESWSLVNMVTSFLQGQAVLDKHEGLGGPIRTQLGSRIFHL